MNVVTKAGTVHGTTEAGTACGTKAANAEATEAAITCKRCAAKVAATEAPTLFDSVTAPVDTLTAEARNAARIARRNALIARNWAEAKAATAKRQAEELASERYATAKALDAIRTAEAKRAAEARAKVATAKANAEAFRARTEARAEARAAELARQAEARKVAAEAKRAADVKAARIGRELALIEAALGGAYVSGAGADMGTMAKAALSEDDAIAEAARHMGRDARALAESWADEKDDMRQARGERLARRMDELNTKAMRPKAEVLAYRKSPAYRAGAKVLAKLGRTRAVVVGTNTNTKATTVYRPTEVPAGLSLAVSRAEVSAKAKAKRLAEIDAKADAAKRAKALEASKAAEAKVSEARAELAKWAEVPTANGWALVKVAEFTKAPSGDRLVVLGIELGDRKDDTVSYVLKAAKGRTFADTTGTKAAGKAANGTVTPEAKRAATKARVAAYRARKRAEAGTEARAYNATARNAK